MKKIGQNGFQLVMDVECAIEKRGTGATSAILVDGCLCRLFDFRVVGETKITIGAQHQDLSAIHQNLCVLVAGNLSEVWVNSFGFGLLRGGVPREFLLKWFHLNINYK